MLEHGVDSLNHNTKGGKMKEHYEAVLHDMEKQERLHESQLAKIKAARPALLALMEDAEAKENKGVPLFSDSTRYAAMGTREAVLSVLAEATKPLSSGEISQKLRDGGIRTQSNDFTSVINSTLASLKKEPAQVERREDGWVAIKAVSSSWDAIVPQPPLRQ